MAGFPQFLQTVLDTTDARELAEFYRQLLGWHYRPGDEPPPPGDDDPRGRDWLVLLNAAGERALAFAQVPTLRQTTWPDDEVPQQMHLDMGVPDKAELDWQHARALELGARLRQDRSEDAEEPLRTYADPSGHLFCIFITAELR